MDIQGHSNSIREYAASWGNIQQLFDYRPYLPRLVSKLNFYSIFNIFIGVGEKFRAGDLIRWGALNYVTE